MSTTLTYSRNSLTHQFIIQLAIDEEDLRIPTPIDRPGMEIDEQLHYLADLVAAIRLNKEEEKSMFEQISAIPTEPEIEEEEEAPEIPSWDEENSEDQEELDEEMENFPNDDDFVEGDDDVDVEIIEDEPES